MAYRQLVEKYAKQLNDANRRIIDLETAIADPDAELEKTKVAETQKCEALKVNEEDKASQKQLEQAQKQVDDVKASLAKAQEELKSAKAANAALTTKSEYAKMSFDNLLAVKGMGERALKDQIEELNNEIKSVNADRKVLNEIIIDLRKPVQDKQDKMADLERSVALEKKRRLEAEALLGPDGKRCKTCNPIVVDLEADEGESAQGSAQPAQEVPDKLKPAMIAAQREVAQRLRQYGRGSKTTRS
ncbi:hypothetical protein KC351_g9221 [Hortaea werneckii]|nr:hypothetical protein KC351_g9221 [Hortaea werneckii]